MILAYAPLLWLVHTWMDPSYDSKGFIVFTICAAMFLWSISSPKQMPQPNDKKIPLFLISLSAFVRLIGQVAAINMVGALTLIVDVYALSKLSALGYRQRAISPFWLAVSFGFSLPLERIVQRTIGYVLQELSAAGACSALGTIFDNIVCHGVRIMINAQDVMVDLPCSGARCTLLLLFFFCVIATVSRFSTRTALVGLLITLASALITNIVRISILAVGAAHPIFGINVMDQPYHDLIGLSLLALGCTSVLWWSSFFSPSKKPVVHPVLDKARWIVPRCVRRDAWWLENKPYKKSKTPVFVAVLCLIAALGITNLPRKAIDVAHTDLPLSLPRSLNNHFAEAVPLTPQEKAYFTQYGGSAQKAIYGDHSLMMVRTSAPLRHLHAPDECLRGLGMKVEYKGMRYGAIPSAIYKATDSNGTSYRIAVSFVPSDDSAITTNVSEAIWRWIQKPETKWTAVQRISLWNASEYDNQKFDTSLIAALDLKTPTSPIQLAQAGAL
jgi:exosortase/archaeosortase family protein